VNDLETALNHLFRTEPDLKVPKEEAAAAVRRHPLAAELVQYWTSEEFYSLRQQVAG
jgi:hypothetical protein